MAIGGTMTTRWTQCPECRGLGKDSAGNVCPVCKGRLAIPMEIELLPKKEDQEQDRTHVRR